MTAKVHRIRPKRHDVITEAVQLVLDLPLGLSDRTRDDLAEVLGKFAPPETWTFMKLNPDQQRYVLKAINASPRPLATGMVWNACVSAGRNTWPASVSSIERPLRRSSGTPTRSSSSLICWLTAPGVTHSSAAALETLW